jgi:hypothetical protein
MATKPEQAYLLKRPSDLLVFPCLRTLLSMRQGEWAVDNCEGGSNIVSVAAKCRQVQTDSNKNSERYLVLTPDAYLLYQDESLSLESSIQGFTRVI